MQEIGIEDLDENDNDNSFKGNYYFIQNFEK